MNFIELPAASALARKCGSVGDFVIDISVSRSCVSHISYSRPPALKRELQIKNRLPQETCRIGFVCSCTWSVLRSMRSRSQ